MYEQLGKFCRYGLTFRRFLAGQASTRLCVLRSRTFVTILLASSPRLLCKGASTPALLWKELAHLKKYQGYSW